MMKPLNKLTIEDLQNTPVWRYDGDSDRRATVIPSPLKDITGGTDIVYVVATDFILHDNTRLHGFSSPQDLSGLDYVQPVIIYRGKHFSLWDENRDTIQVDELARAIGKNVTDILPLTLQSNVQCDGHIPTMEITTE